MCLVWGYCSKGSLEDVLSNDNIKLDWMFKLSFIIDMAKVSFSSGLLTVASSIMRQHYADVCMYLRVGGWKVVSGIVKGEYGYN